MASVKNRLYSIQIDVDGIRSYLRLNYLSETSANTRHLIKGKKNWNWQNIAKRRSIVSDKQTLDTKPCSFAVVKDFDSCRKKEATVFLGLDIAEFYVKQAQRQAKEMYKKGERPRFFLKRVIASELGEGADAATAKFLKNKFGV